MAFKEIKLNNLPQEILENIYLSENLTFYDYLNISRVCKTLNVSSSSNKIWRFAYKNRWPLEYKRICSQHFVWKEKFKERYQSFLKLKVCLHELFLKYYSEDDISYSELDILQINVNQWEYETVMEDLFWTIDNYLNEDLHYKHIAKKVIRQLKHVHMISLWEEYLSVNYDKCELGALLLYQWFRPFDSFTLENIEEELEILVNLIKTEVANRNGSHPLIRHPEHLNKAPPAYSESESLVILKSLSKVLFTSDWMVIVKDKKKNNSCYLETFTKWPQLTPPVTLVFIFVGLARKLGVPCYLIKLVGHVLFQYSPETPTYYYDLFENGLELSDLYFESHDILQLCGHREVMKYILEFMVEVGRQEDIVYHYFLQDSLELYCFLFPDNVEAQVSLARMYLASETNLQEALEILDGITLPNYTFFIGNLKDQILHVNETKKKNVKLRCQIKHRSENKKVHYRVGMIMFHLKYKYKCVIYGWDSTCQAEQLWMKKMGVYNLKNKDQQPFYHVLVDDNTTRYAAEENLVPLDSPVNINHSETGKYFDKFDGKCYLPNELKSKEFPDDYVVPENNE